MKISKEQYQKAKTGLGKLEPKLKSAREIVTTWEKAVEGERREVTSVNVTPEGTELTYRKEARRDDAAA